MIWNWKIKPVLFVLVVSWASFHETMDPYRKPFLLFCFFALDLFDLVLCLLFFYFKVDFFIFYDVLFFLSRQEFLCFDSFMQILPTLSLFHFYITFVFFVFFLLSNEFLNEKVRFWKFNELKSQKKKLENFNYNNKKKSNESFERKSLSMTKRL